MTTAASLSPTRRPLLTARFDEEWARLVADTSTRARVAAWAEVEPDLAPFTKLPEVLVATGWALAEAHADRVLAAVVRRAAEDAVAARTVLQRLLPGLVSIALRRARTGRWRARPLFDELTAVGWVAIRTYPMERRPAKVAVNLLRDAEYQVCVRPFRLSVASELPFSAFEGRGPVQAPNADRRGRRQGAHNPSDEVAAVLADGHAAGVAEADVELLRALYLDGEPVHAVAARLGVSPRTVLSRRLAATANLRATATEPATAA